MHPTRDTLDDSSAVTELARWVVAVRVLQKRYFAGDKSVLGEARAAEKALDRMVSEILSPASQQELF